MDMDIFVLNIYKLQRNNIYKTHYFIILLLIFMNFSFTLSFNFMRSFTLRSGNIILLNENGTYYYNKNEEKEEEIFLFNSTYKGEKTGDYDYAYLKQFPSNGFIIFKLKEKFYFIKNEKNYLCEIDILNIPDSKFLSIFTIKYENSGKFSFGISYSDSLLYINIYEIFLTEEEKCSLNIIKSMNTTVTNSENRTMPTNERGVICGMMNYYIFGYDILACFYIPIYPSEIGSFFFDPNNEY